MRQAIRAVGARTRGPAQICTRPRPIEQDFAKFKLCCERSKPAQTTGRRRQRSAILAQSPPGECAGLCEKRQTREPMQDALTGRPLRVRSRIGHRRTIEDGPDFALTRH